MPMPMPGKDEDQDKFMSRCMQMMTKENEHKPSNEKRPQKQMVAMCFSQWKNKDSKSSKENIEIDFASDEFVQKFLEKYPQYKSYFEEK